jgi:excisionase family DNA binding protein
MEQNTKSNEAVTAESKEWKHFFLLKRHEVAQWLSCSQSTLRELVKSGELPHVKIGAMKRFAPEDVLDFIDSHKKSGTSWTKEPLENFEKVINAAFEGQTKSEIFLKPAELLEMARRTGAFTSILFEVSNASALSETHRRSERMTFAKAVEKVTGRTFNDGIRFDSIGEGHSKRYKFTRDQLHDHAR